MLKKYITIILLVCICISSAFAQRKRKNREDTRSPKQELIYENKTYLPVIRTVQALPNGKEGKLPIIDLEIGEQLMVSFDDLRGDVRTFYYSIEHCDMNWQPSRLTTLDYAKGFNEDRISDFQSSQGTTQGYTHYSFSFPNEYVGPKISGNYLLKVYEDADKDRLIFTQRFYAYRGLVQVSANTQVSPTASHRNTHQKLNVTLKTGLTISNPDRDLQVLVMQNRRTDYQMVLNKPMFAGNNEFTYNNSQTLDFQGNNEFRLVDLRSFRVASTHVKEILMDSTIRIHVMDDEDLNGSPYASTFDENGTFYIRNMDINEEEQTTSDYGDVTFSLKAPKDVKGNIYLVGPFNNYQRKSDNQLTYNEESKTWQVTVKLKQGLYDYDYVLVSPDGKEMIDAFSGSHFATGNSYQILIYNRRMGTYWDELVGFEEVGINNRQP